jgi:endoglucanase
MREMVADLEVLSNQIGVSGYESRVRDAIASRISDLANEVRVDPLGNLLAVKEGRVKQPRILLDAHMDEVGFLVSHIDEGGFIRFEKMGGWDDRNLLGHPVRFPLDGGDRDGVIGTRPPHIQEQGEKEKTIKVAQMFVDVAASGREEVSSMGIEVGSPFTIYHPFQLLGQHAAMGKAFDDRAGCAILIEVLRRLGEVEHDPTVVFNFAVCEEVGGRGATTGAYALEPDVALAVESTTACDTPGVPPERCPSCLGKGPAVTIADKSIVANAEVIAKLRKLAEKAGTPYQLKKPLYGGTDAGRIALARGGVPAGVLSIPCRYIHNGISLLRLDDLEATCELTYAFCVSH